MCQDYVVGHLIILTIYHIQYYRVKSDYEVMRIAHHVTQNLILLFAYIFKSK